MITFIACCCSAMCSGAKLEFPIRESKSHEDLRNLIQTLSVAVMTLWSQELISTEVALIPNIPSFPYGDCHIKPKNKTDTADVVLARGGRHDQGDHRGGEGA